VIWLDNMSTAVKKILADGEREVTDNFRRLQCHFSFESNFCNPVAGYEKGSVENYVGTARRNYFVPIPHFDDIEIYNQELLTRCYQDLNRQHYKKKVSVYQLFQEDLEAMASLPSSPFEAVNYQLARTNRQGMVTYHAKLPSTILNYFNSLAHHLCCQRCRHFNENCLRCFICTHDFTPPFYCSSF
ncbi:transposase, partial [Atopobacter sp. AH10]